MNRDRTDRGSKPLRSALLAVLLPISGLFPALAEEAALPPADSVLEKYLEATGGREAHEGVRNAVTEGTMEMPAQGIALQVTVWVARPNLSYTRTDSEVTGRIEKGSNGTVVWEKSVMAGPRVLEGQEREDYLRESALDKHLRWRDFYESGEVTGIEDVAGRSCWVLVLKSKGGKPQTLYVDRESGLISKVAMTLDTPMGSVPVETTLEDYREAEGIRSAFRAHTKIVGQERVMTVKSIRRNVDVPPGLFALPAEIEELVAKKAAPPAAPAEQGGEGRPRGITR